MKLQLNHSASTRIITAQTKFPYVIHNN